MAWDTRWQNNDFDFKVVKYTPVSPPEGLINFSTQTITDLGRPYGFFDLNDDFLDDLVTTSTTQIDAHYQNANGTLTHQTINTPTAAYEATWSMAAGDLDGNLLFFDLYLILVILLFGYILCANNVFTVNFISIPYIVP